MSRFETATTTILAVMLVWVNEKAIFCSDFSRVLRARGGSESLYGSAWFGSVWVGILGGIAHAGFSHRESALPDPPNDQNRGSKFCFFSADRRREASLL